MLMIKEKKINHGFAKLLDRVREIEAAKSKYRKPMITRYQLAEILGFSHSMGSKFYRGEIQLPYTALSLILHKYPEIEPSEVVTAIKEQYPQ